MTATREARVSARAKLNLDLRVLHKRPDGYHELRTVFQTISLADRIDIVFTPARRTKIELESSIDIPDNLIVRTARLVLEAGRVTGNVRFRLHKRIPMGGGLGGGSTDAAAVLLALPVLAGVDIPPDTLHSLATEIGSDVPFFLEGGTALGIGRGEELYLLPDARLGPMLVLTPDIHVSTPEAYRALGRGLTFNELSHTLSGFRSFVSSLGGGLSTGVECPSGENDFERVVFASHPELKALKRKLLRSGARSAMMTGSGSTLFAVFRDREERKKALAGFSSCSSCPVSAVSRQRYRSLWRRQLRAHITENAWPPLSRYSR